MRQTSLFDLLPRPDESVGLAGLMPDVRAEMAAAAREYTQGRKVLADEVTGVAQREGVALTPGGAKVLKDDLLEKWLQPGERGHDPSFAAILCFCLAVRSARPLRPALKALKLAVVAEEDLEFLEYGKLCAAEKKLREKKKKVEARL